MPPSSPEPSSRRTTGTGGLAAAAQALPLGMSPAPPRPTSARAPAPRTARRWLSDAAAALSAAAGCASSDAVLAAEARPAHERHVKDVRLALARALARAHVYGAVPGAAAAR